MERKESTEQAGTENWNLDNHASSGNTSLTLVVKVDAILSSSITRHTRYWRDWSSDVCSSDLDTETTAVATSADLELTLSDSPDPVTAGNNLTYTIDVTNHGPSDRKSVV